MLHEITAMKAPKRNNKPIIRFGKEHALFILGLFFKSRCLGRRISFGFCGSHHLPMRRVVWDVVCYVCCWRSSKEGIGAQRGRTDGRRRDGGDGAVSPVPPPPPARLQAAGCWAGRRGAGVVVVCGIIIVLKHFSAYHFSIPARAGLAAG